jgi:hypothetical protein
MLKSLVSDSPKIFEKSQENEHFTNTYHFSSVIMSPNKNNRSVITESASMYIIQALEEILLYSNIFLVSLD